ncbi:uncharacterized protein L203_105273 [Cryptococcus depauperatus CBS 7841]|uniref:Uncharacterized protein n=1 Tax=Cryptococcus depauperatus CBS 7841 TaxID=1295531 RepID=A0AAJ8JXC4_9TREE
MSSNSPKHTLGFSPSHSGRLFSPKKLSGSLSAQSLAIEKHCAERVTISFPKLPIPASTAVSTDSEAGGLSSDWHISGDTRTGTQSPSLISTIFQSHSFSRSRQPSSASTNESPYPTPVTPSTSATLNGGIAKPILRRGTFSTSGEECGQEIFQVLGLGVAKVSKDAVDSVSKELPLKKKKSVLTFAVNSCPRLPESSNTNENRARSRFNSISTSLSNTSDCSNFRPRPYNRHSPLPESSLAVPAETDTNHDDTEEEGSGFVKSPIAIPGHKSDSDEGYYEDEEDGFTTDEEEEVNGFETFTNVPKMKHKPSWANTLWTKALLPDYSNENFSIPRRRGRTFEPVGFQPSTTDETTLQPRQSNRKKLSIHIVTDKLSPPRCTRHRSPPPLHLKALPAARSPSAAELCRTRSSVASTTSSANHIHNLASNRSKRGWKSDDTAFQCRNVPQSAVSVTADIENNRARISAIPLIHRKHSLPLGSGNTLIDGILLKTSQESNQPTDMIPGEMDGDIEGEEQG